MIHRYKNVAVLYGGTGKKYAEAFRQELHRLSVRQRYPIAANLILERILTQELLTSLTQLFRESDYCVAFLTADDCCISENGRRTRLRQNVVFELGMAILQLGRERCILLSDFDPQAPEFELPSDMQSLSIFPFAPENLPDVIETVTEKILQMTGEGVLKEPPRYDNLLQRTAYYINYEELFPRSGTMPDETGETFLKRILDVWQETCQSLLYYDERSIYLLERIGFLPIFGKNLEVQQWLLQMKQLLSQYTAFDVSFYPDVQLLNFVKNSINCIIAYTEIKTTSEHPTEFQYRKLLQEFLAEPIPQDHPCNPLILVAYYDYLGLTYLKLCHHCGDLRYAQQAKSAFETALSLTDRVDLALQIWKGFLFYNLARVLAIQELPEEAARAYENAVHIRKQWLKNCNYPVLIRNALSTEYFQAELDRIEMCQTFRLLSEAQIESAYHDIEIELDAYCNTNTELQQLQHIRTRLKKRH